MQKLRFSKQARVIASMALVVSQALVAEPATAADVLLVPSDYPTIQAAIDAANDGDVINVGAGTYVEQIDYLGKDITIQSTDGPEATIIDGGGSGPVVTIVAGSGLSPAFTGFTVTGGGGFGGGILTSGGPALIQQNIVRDNAFCTGSGIEAAFSSAVIQDNVITGNRQSGCVGGPGGGGIALRGAGSARVLRNIISGNAFSSLGGGIGLFAAGTPTIDSNVIIGNTSSEGGGISLVNFSDATITNNVISGNRASTGAGISWQFGGAGPRIVNNTITKNELGSTIHADTIIQTSLLVNNIIQESGTAPVIECAGEVDTSLIRFNDVVNSGTGSLYGGTCSDLTGLNGNVSLDPAFVNESSGDYHLSEGSPLIDAGTNDGAPSGDFDGDSRPIDGDGDGVGLADIGADEVPIPPLVIDSDTVLGADQSRPVVVVADGITLDCAGHAVSGPGAVGINLDGRQNVTVRKCTVSGYDVGFSLNSATDNRLLDNTAVGNLISGFELHSAHNNWIEGNSSSNSGCDGFVVASSNANSFRSNSATDNVCHGFGLFGSSENVLENNHLARNGEGFFLQGASTNRLARNVIEDSAGIGVAIYSESNSNTFVRNVVRRSGAGNGFELFESHLNRFESNTVSASGASGFNLIASTQNALIANSSVASGGNGYQANDRSTDNTFERNVAQDNGGEGFVTDGENRFMSNVALRNSTGFVLLGEGADLESNIANQNLAGGYYVAAGGSNNAFASNKAFSNGSAGFSTDPEAHDNSYVRNVACNNGLTDGTEDAIDAGSNNIWINNRFCSSAGF